jgi:hypothetical protein
VLLRGQIMVNSRLDAGQERAVASCGSHDGEPPHPGVTQNSRPLVDTVESRGFLTGLQK